MTAEGVNLTLDADKGGKCTAMRPATGTLPRDCGHKRPNGKNECWVYTGKQRRGEMALGELEEDSSFAFLRGSGLRMGGMSPVRFLRDGARCRRAEVGIVRSGKRIVDEDQ